MLEEPFRAAPAKDPLRALRLSGLARPRSDVAPPPIDTPTAAPIAPWLPVRRGRRLRPPTTAVAMASVADSVDSGRLLAEALRASTFGGMLPVCLLSNRH